MKEKSSFSLLIYILIQILKNILIFILITTLYRLYMKIFLLNEYFPWSKMPKTFFFGWIEDIYWLIFLVAPIIILSAITTIITDSIKWSKTSDILWQVCFKLKNFNFYILGTIFIIPYSVTLIYFAYFNSHISILKLKDFAVHNISIIFFAIETMTLKQFIIIVLAISLPVIYIYLNKLILKAKAPNYNKNINFYIKILLISLTLIFNLSFLYPKVISYLKHKIIKSNKNNIISINPNEIIKREIDMHFHYLYKYFNKLNNDEEKLTKKFERLSNYKNIKKQKLSKNPHIVVLFVENMTQSLLELDSKSFPIMGELKKHFQQDYWFKKAISGMGLINFSWGAVNLLLYNTAPVLITNKLNKKNAKSISNITPFINNKYETFFIAGYKLNKYHQRFKNTADSVGFNNFLDSTKIRELTKTKLKPHNWHQGAHDEDLLKAILILLKKAKQPLFIFAETTSTHSFVKVPKHHKKLIFKNDKKIINTNYTEEIQTILNLARYSNDQLALFIKEIKNSNLKDNTIIVITGDHSNNYHFKFQKDSFIHNYGVPLYFYLPKKYRKKHMDKMLEQYVSHDAIFPTLYQIALNIPPKTPYRRSVFDPLRVNMGISFYFYITPFGIMRFYKTEFREFIKLKKPILSKPENDMLEWFKAYYGVAAKRWNNFFSKEK